LQVSFVLFWRYKTILKQTVYDTRVKKTLSEEEKARYNKSIGDNSPVKSSDIFKDFEELGSLYSYVCIGNKGIFHFLLKEKKDMLRIFISHDTSRITVYFNYTKIEPGKVFETKGMEEDLIETLLFHINNIH
tara:strand:+ start:444 stop:839 length:396 start_codon:yes stop_codon:yes gene_type:complete